MQQVPPMRIREKYFRSIEAEIQRLFDRLIYNPLLNILLERTPDMMLNTSRAMVTAARQGRIWYEDGKFKGTFSAALSRELLALGAHWNPKSQTFTLDPIHLPADVQIAMAEADGRYEAMRRAMLTTLDDIDVAVVDTLSTTPTQYAKTIDQMEMDFRKSVSGMEAVSIDIKLTDAQRRIIAEQWGTNLNLYIKGWAADNILKLRQQIQENTLNAGGRYQAMVKTIQDNYGVSKNKAKFLARQETGLLMSKFQETRLRDIGVTKYRWSTSHDERVRPANGANAINGDHRILDGKIFRFDSPPITCQRTGARNNPGEDYNCRCVAIGLVD